MTLLRSFLFLLLAGFGLPAAAMQFERCTKGEIAYATAAVDGARDLILRASARVGDTPEYRRWFGTWHPERGERVRAGLKSVDQALGGADLTLVCPGLGEHGCLTGTYATVRADRPFRLHLCEAFFTMPTMEGVVPEAADFNWGTREGTIIHEVSHFHRTAGTRDHCYARDTCAEMALREPNRAIENADSFQYFTEDVMFTLQAAQAGQ